MSEQETTANSRGLVMRAAGLVGAAVLLSRLVGLGRDMVTKYYLAVVTLEASAFDAAIQFPETIFLIIAGGAIGSAFIPTFAAYFAQDDAAGGWRLFSAIVNMVTLVMVLVCGFFIWQAPQFVTWFFPELVTAEPDFLPLTVQLMRIMLLSPIIFGASGVFMAALNARQHFLLPALAPSIYNLGIIAGGILWPTEAKEVGLAWGTVVGATGHLAIQLPGLRQKGASYRPVLTLRDPGVQQVLRLMAPRVLGLSFSEINKWVTLFLSGLMPVGSIPALRLALRLMIMPQGILGQAMGIAAFPTLAELAARQKWEEMRQIVVDSLRMMLFLGIPASVVLMTLRHPLIVILFERGEFTAEDTTLVTWALLFYGIGLVALTMLEVVARAFYALSDTLTPVLAGGVQVLLMGLLSLLFGWLVFPALGWAPLGGLALAFSLSNFLEVGLLLWLLWRRLRGLNGRYLLDGLLRMGGAGLLMAGVTELLLWQMAATSVWLQAVVGGLAGGLAYLLACALLRVAELDLIWRQISKRLTQRHRDAEK
jgi:putative peptidoglycan lipid II flippase